MVEAGSGERPGDALDWLSAHLFFAGTIDSSACDLLLSEVVAPLVANHDGRWFFIRYNEDGPHVRLRLEASVIEHDALRATIERAASASSRVERLAFVPYEPEVDRYGGPDGIALAEDVFHHASATALALAPSLGDRSARFGKALLAMLVQWHAVAGERADVAALAGDYARGYLVAQVPDAEHRGQWLARFEAGVEPQAERLAGYVEAAWEALVADETLTPELDVFRARMDAAADRLRALCDAGRLTVDGRFCADWSIVVQRIVSSTVHLMNNRLGVPIRDECYLGIVLERCLLPADVAVGGEP